MTRLPTRVRPGDSDELQELWDSLPEEKLDPQTKQILPTQVVARLERADRWQKRRRASLAALATAAALVLLLRSAVTPSSSESESDPELTSQQNAVSSHAPETSPSSDSLAPALPQPSPEFSPGELVAALSNPPSTRELLNLGRAWSEALSHRKREHIDILLHGLLDVRQEELPQSAQQAWNESFAKALEALASSAEALLPAARWSKDLKHALEGMPPHELEQLAFSELEPQLLSPEAASLVGAALVRTDRSDRLFELGMKFHAYEEPALQALQDGAGSEWLRTKLQRTSHRGSSVVLRAIAKLQPDSGMEYAERFVRRASLREDALLAIAAYPASISLPILLDCETRYGPAAVHSSLARLLEREGDQVAALGLPPDVRRQEEVVDALFAHGTPAAAGVLLSWALRPADSDGFLQKAERERLILAAPNWGFGQESERLQGAFAALDAEDKSLAAAALLSIARMSSTETAIDTALGGASRNTKQARDLSLLLKTNRRERGRGDAFLLLQLRRLLRDLPPPSAEADPDHAQPIDSMYLHSGISS